MFSCRHWPALEKRSSDVNLIYLPFHTKLDKNYKLKFKNFFLCSSSGIPKKATYKKIQLSIHIFVLFFEIFFVNLSIFWKNTLSVNGKKNQKMSAYLNILQVSPFIFGNLVKPRESGRKAILKYGMLGFEIDWGFDSHLRIQKGVFFKKSIFSRKFKKYEKPNQNPSNLSKLNLERTDSFVRTEFWTEYNEFVWIKFYTDGQKKCVWRSILYGKNEYVI